MNIEVVAPGREPVRETVGFPIGLIKEARLVMTDDLIRESLRRAKTSREARGDTDDLMDGSLDSGGLEVGKPGDREIGKSRRKPPKPRT